MIKFFTEVMWIFDFYFAWMFYNGYKMFGYHRYMLRKWGKRYRDRCPGCPESL